MMKRMFLLLATVFVLIGCSSAYQDAIADAEAALENGDFESALSHYQAALEEKQDSSEVQAMIDLLLDFETLQEKMEEFEWDEALALANDMLENDGLDASLQEEVETSLTTIEEAKEKEEKIASKLKKIEKQIDEEQIEKAQSELEKLASDVKSTSLKSKVDDLHKKAEKTEKRIAEKKQKEEEEAEQKRKEEEKRLEEEKQTADTKDLFNKYHEKADELGLKIAKEAAELYGNNPPAGFYGQYGSEWKDLLNEVYSVLEDTMPKDEFAALEAEHKDWERRKEERFAELPDGSAVERGAGMDFLTNLNADRTNYLIGTFMQ